MALSKEEQEQLDALTRKANEPDDDDNFDIEIWDSEGAGAKVPYRKGKSWLQRFGIDVEPPPDATDDDKGDGKTKPKSASKTDKGDRPGPATRYFGNKQAS